MAMENPTAADASRSALPGSDKLKPTYDAAQLALCIQFLRQFRIGLAQALLYSSGTIQFERSTSNICSSLTAALEAIGAFKLTFAKGDALINGERIETPASIRSNLEQVEKILSEANAGSVWFEPGITTEELGPFLQLLARKKFPSGDSAQVNEFLRQNSIAHIKIDDLRYVAIGTEQRVVTGDGPSFSGHAVAQKALTELVDATIDSIEKVADSQARDQLRAELTDQFIEKSTSMLPSMISTASQRLKTSAPDDLVALAAIPPRDGQLLKHVLKLGTLLHDRGAAEDDESMVTLRQLVHDLVTPYEARAEDIVAQLKNETIPPNLLPEWLTAVQDSMKRTTAAERVEGILKQSPFSLVDEQMFSKIVDVLDELSVAGMESEAEQITTHVSGALRAPTKRERIKVVKNLSFLLTRSMEQSTTAMGIIEDALLKACTHETCDEVMNLLLEHLSNRCMHHYKLKNFKRALEHLEWIVSLEESSRLALRDEGANLARLAREALSRTPFALALANDLLEEGEKSETANRMIHILGANVWGALIDMVRSDSNEAHAHALAAMIGRMSSDAVQCFYNALGRETEPAVALRMLHLSPIVGDDASMWPAFQSLLRHENESVRAFALETVIHHDGEHAVRTLVRTFCEDNEPRRRPLWLQALTQIKDPSAQEVLLSELHDAVDDPAAMPDEQLVTLVLESLSAAGNEGIVPCAAKLVRPRGRTLMLGRGDSPGPSKALTMTAIKALAPFYKVPQAIEALEEARKSKDPEIARYALVALRGIVAAERNTETGVFPRSTDAAPAESAAPRAPVAPAPSPARISKPQETTLVSPKTRRVGEPGSEGLAPPSPADVFQPGAVIGGSTGMVPPPPPPRKQAPREVDLFDLKPSLEGQVGTFGLSATVRMISGKDGVLRVQGPDSEGRIYIRARKVISASYADKQDLAAIAAMDQIKGTRFQFFVSIAPPSAELSIPAETLQKALENYRDELDRHLSI